VADQDTIYVRGEGGSIFRLALPLHESIADRLAKGYLVQVNEDGSPYTGEPEPSVPALPTEPPAVSAVKADWVGWAVACGATPDDAEAMTKADLIEKYGKGGEV
jgi:hypothetical protein